jgi:hypothetical protein
VAVAPQVVPQDVAPRSDRTVALRQGVADWGLGVQDPDMRHGRTSRSRRGDGNKRHVRRDRASGLIRSVGVTLANVPAARATEAIGADAICGAPPLSRPGFGHGSALARYAADFGSLLIRLAQENPRGASANIQGALLKLGSAMVRYLSEGAIPT